jgi:hypothetical protein
MCSLFVAVTGLTGCAARGSEPFARLPADFRTQSIAPPQETISGPWVLWYHYAFRPPVWSRHSGYATLEECQSQVKAMAAQAALSREVGRRLLESGAGFVPGVGGAVTRNAVTSSLAAQMADGLMPRFICLAADVDPRTPPKDKESPARLTSPP